MIIAGDIGGTKTVIALYERTTSGLHQTVEHVFASAHYDALEAILSEFLARLRRGQLYLACFGIAGAIIEGRVHTTNLTWNVSEAAVETALKCPVRLLNDLQATAFGVRYLSPDELEVLNTGAPVRHKGNVAVIAAGTGLGEAFLCWDGTRHHPMATEGGHADFAPRNEQEIELLRYLRKQFGNHISNERVLSGPGIYNIYCFLRDTAFAPEPQWLTEALNAGGTTAPPSPRPGWRAKVRCAWRRCGCSRRSMEPKRETGLALHGPGRGFVAGGIAPKLLPALRGDAFTKAPSTKAACAKC